MRSCLMYFDSQHDQNSATLVGMNIGDPTDGPLGPLTVYGWILIPPPFSGHVTPALDVWNRLKSMGLLCAPWQQHNAAIQQMYARQQQAGAQAAVLGQEQAGQHDGFGQQQHGQQVGFGQQPEQQPAFSGHQEGFGSQGVSGEQVGFGQLAGSGAQSGIDHGALGGPAAADALPQVGLGQQRAGFGVGANVHGFGTGGPQE